MTTDGWSARYLSLLGAGREAPGVAALGRLVRAHVEGVPFENSLSLLRRRESATGPVAPLDPDALLDAWEARRAGGVCFEHTEMFGRLLMELGYDVTPVAGEISFPGSHQALLVRADGARWLVDVGNGAPFFEPIPLDRPHEIQRLGLGYRFGADPGRPGVWVQERALDGGWQPYCRYDLRPQAHEARVAAYQRHHRPRETWVTSSMVAIRSREQEVRVFRNGEQHVYTPPGKVSTRIQAPADWAALPGLLGLPRLPVREVAQAWAGINDLPLPPGI